MRSTRRGFTLIELLVVVAIIGILSAVIMVGLNDVRERSRDAARLSSIREVQNALELYRTQTGAYPAITTADDLFALEAYLSPTYIRSISYDMLNVSGPTYFRVGDGYVILVSLEQESCKTGNGPLDNYYPEIPRCQQ